MWINLGATGGIGLQGPGATNAARTLIAALLHALPATTVVSDRYTVAALLGAHPHQRPHTGDDRAPAHSYRRVHVVDHPRDVLDYAHAHLHQHAPTTLTTLTTPTTSTAPTAGASPPPLVLVLPSPTNPATRDALAATLRRGRPHGVVALLHGPWPLGWNCHLDEHHRITRHSPVDPHDPTPAIRPAHLTGATIAATSTTDLRALLDAVPGLDDPPDVPAHPCPPAVSRPLAATAPDPGPTTTGERAAVDTAEPDAAPTAHADAEDGAAQPIPPTISTPSRETAGRDPDRAHVVDDAAAGRRAGDRRQ